MRPIARYATLLLAAALPALGALSCSLIAGIEDVIRVDAGADAHQDPDVASKPDADANAEPDVDADADLPAFPAVGAPTGTNGIHYHGGPVMLGTVNLYYVFYGAWSAEPTIGLLIALGKTIGGSPYFNVNTTYFDGDGNHVSGDVHFGEKIIDGYSQGQNLSRTSVKAAVTTAIKLGKLPADANGVYVVLTSADVTEAADTPTVNGSFCGEIGPVDRRYCGWHDTTNLDETDLKVVFVGGADRCPSACISPEIQAYSPNMNPSADAMASELAAQLAKTVTNPDHATNPAWENAAQPPSTLPLENSDLCAGKLGAEYVFPPGTGYKANIHLGGTGPLKHDYLLQQNFVNQLGGACTLGIDWSSLGGAMDTAPSATSWGGGRFDIVFAVQNGSIQHTYADKWNFPVNAGFDPLPGKVAFAPAIVASSVLHLDTFGAGDDSSLIWDQFTGGNVWVSQPSLVEGAVASAPAAAVIGPNRIAVFALLAGGTLYMRTFNNNVPGPWEQLSSSTFLSAPAVVSWGVDHLDLFLRGTDDGLYHRSFDGTWSAPEKLLGGTIIDAPAAASIGPGQLDVFGRSPDNTLLHWRYDKGVWSEAESLGTPLYSAPTAVIDSTTGRVDLFTRGADNALWHRVAQETVTTGAESWAE